MNILILMSFVIGASSGAKILGIFHFPSKSHHILGSALLKGLAKRGHDVTMISPFPLDIKVPNYTDVKLEGLIEFVEGKTVQNFVAGHKTFLNRMFTLIEIMDTINELTLKSDAIKTLLESNATYDVFITEYIFNGAFLAIANKLNAKAVIFKPLGTTTDIDKMVGNTSPYCYVPHPMLPFTSEMNFVERVLNTILITFGDWFFYFTSKQYYLAQKYFPDSPPLEELTKNVSLVLVNTHYSTEYPRPYVPNIIPIGGFHIEEPKTLPNDLETFLNDARNGVVLFSFGTAVKLSMFSEEKLTTILNVLGRLPMKILFKSDIEISNPPENVLVKKWLPQNDILEAYSHLFSTGLEGMLQKARIMRDYFYTLTDMTLNSTAVQNILKSNEKYDLLIMEMFYNEAFLGLAYKINSRVIIFNPIGSTPQLDKLTGNSSPLSYVPNFLLPYTSEMDFFQRTINVLTTIFFDVFSTYFSKQQDLYKKYFTDAPPLDVLEKEFIDLALVNTHYSNESPRPFVPNVVPIGGFHLEDSKEISEDLKIFLDRSKNGVVFFSFGSNLKISALSNEKKEVLLKVFKKLQLNVLMVSETDLGDLPINIKVKKWVPQNDILAHPNVKLFISHGGFGSTTEAIYHGVPIIGIPFFGDQSKNVADCVRKGFAIQIDLSDISEEKLQGAIDEILNNPKYRNNVKRVSSLLKDQPLKPMDNAIFWIEHIIRHNGGTHLKNAGANLAWYQYFLLDVIAFVIAIVILTIFLVYLSCRACFRCAKIGITSKLKND